MTTPEERRATDYEWKRSVDERLGMLLTGQHASTAERGVLRERIDHLGTSIENMTTSITDLNAVLSAGRGGVAMLYLLAKLCVAMGAIAGAIYATKAWVLK